MSGDFEWGKVDSAARPFRVALILENGWRGDYVELRALLERLAPNLVALTPVSPLPGRSSFESNLKKHWRCVPFGTLAKLTWLLARQALDGGGDDITSLVRSHPELRSKMLVAKSINDPDYLSELRARDPDVIVSYGCPQIFKKPLLALPRRCCINLHPGELPRFRGPSPLFYALLDGEAQITVTIHVMEPGIDDGLVIGTRVLPIDPASETLWNLGTRRVPAVALPLLESVLAGIARGDLKLDGHSPQGAGTYRSWPSADEIRQFFARGRHLI